MVNNTAARVALAALGGAIPGALISKGLADEQKGQNGTPEVVGGFASILPVSLGLAVTVGAATPGLMGAMAGGMVAGFAGVQALSD